MGVGLGDDRLGGPVGESFEEVEYVHIQFDADEIGFAEGAKGESLLPRVDGRRPDRSLLALL